MKLRRVYLSGLLLVVVSAMVLIGISGCKAAAPPETVKTPKTLTVALSYSPKFLAINYDYDGANYFIISNICSKLVNYNGRSEIYGDLAESWDVSTDGLAYTFRLRKGVTWHDGEPFTADDVVFTVESMVAENGYGAKDTVKGVESVKALDENTVVFSLAEPNSSFLPQLATRYGFVIIPKHIYEGTDPRTNPANTAPIGTGPFKFVELVSGSHVTLSAFDDYYQGRPAIDTLVFKTFPDVATAVVALEAGSVDFLANAPPFTDLPRLEGIKGVKVDPVPSEIAVWLAFNLDRKPFDDLRVRQAIGHALNTTQINDLVYQGRLTAANTVYCPTFPTCNQDALQPAYNPALAEQLLDEAGLPRKADGTRFSMTYTAFKASVWGAKEIGDVMQQQMEAVGISLEVEYLDFALFSEKILNKRDFDISWSGGPHGPDPQVFSNFVGTGGGRNAMGYSNAEVDGLFREMRLLADPTESQLAFDRLQEIIAEDLPRLTIAQWIYPYAHKDTVSGGWWEEASKWTIPQDCYWAFTKSD